MSRKKYIILTVAAVFLSAIKAFSQNQPSFEQYHFNQLTINPAYAGSQSTLEASLFYRKQWTRFPGSPKTINATIHTKLSSDKIGVGLKILQEEVGPTNKLQLGLQYAYRIHTNAGVLAIGIEGSMTNYHLNYGELTAFLDGDPAFTNQPENTWSPNVGAGIWFESNRFYFGASSPVLIEDKLSGTTTTELSQLNIFDAHRHYYISTGALIGETDKIAVKPYTLIKYGTGSPVQVDANVSLIFKNSFWIGASYRTNNSMSILAEYFINRNNALRKNIFGIGYAYSFSMEDIQNFFGPTHEIFFTYSFDKHETRYTNPRFF